jgi:hypothetical protein
MVLDGSLWADLLMAFTRHSSCTPRGWSFDEAILYDMSTNVTAVVL